MVGTFCYYYIFYIIILTIPDLPDTSHVTIVKLPCLMLSTLKPMTHKKSTVSLLFYLSLQHPTM